MRLTIYNLLGQKVTTLVGSKPRPGLYRMVWRGFDSTGRPVASGVYFYRLHAEAEDGTEFTQTRRMLLVK